MDFQQFFSRCQNEDTISDFESYLSYCIFEKKKRGGKCTVEEYNRIRDLAFERRDESAAKALFDLAAASEWNEGEWEGALR